MIAGMDILIISLYLLATLLIGLWGSRKASQNMDEFFLAGRKMTWFIAGTSMVATTFAADTPLWVTGTVAKNGIAGNWFWWNMAIGHVLAAVIFAPLWRRSRVFTDAELIELRYGAHHRPATILRSVKAFYFALVFNVITMGWVILAMKKILIAILGPHQQWTIPLLIVMVIFAMLYSVLGGLVSVIVTDLVQFMLGLVGAILMAAFALKAVGGMTELQNYFTTHYQAEQAAELMSFFPSSDSYWMPLSALIVYLGVQWWGNKSADGGGYFVQRMGASSDGAAASKATFWFSIAHYTLRPWPWIIVALCALVLYPLNENPDLDRELTYPLMMVTILPAGVKGLVICSLLAAFMSTIDTHLNWGTSYIVRDIYQRFFKPDASDKKLILVSRISLVAMTFLAIILALTMDTIQTGWELIFSLGAGWGAAIILRWLWWRTNAESELAAMITATILTLIMNSLATIYTIPFHFKLLTITVVATIASLAAIFIWPVKPTEPHLAHFIKLVSPPGRWQTVIKKQNILPTRKEHPWWSRVILIFTGIIAIYGLLFGIGKLLFSNYVLGSILLSCGLAGVVITWWGLNKLYKDQDPEAETTTTA